MRNGRVNRLIGETGKIVMSVNRIKTIIETFLGSDMPGEVQQRFASNHKSNPEYHYQC